jgi:DNA-binding CsgD family transcriptional regulator
MIFAFAAGAGLGKLYGSLSLQMAGSDFSMLSAAFLTAFIIGMSIVPLLVKYIDKEMSEEKAGALRPGFNAVAEADTAVLEKQGKDAAGLNDKWPGLLDAANAALPPDRRLTVREIEITLLLLDRYDYETIAKKLFISKNTLKAHIGHIYTKLQVTGKKNLTEFVLDFEAKISDKAPV